ncbi:MAG: C40 family peptidase [Haloplanus sp.]
MSLEARSRELQARARIALETCRSIHAPDERTCCFDLTVDARTDRQRLVLRGAVETERLLRLARSSVRDATGHTVTTRDVTVLETRTRTRTVTATALPVRSAPDDDGEQVTQALVGDSLEAFEERGRWTRVRVPDGYLGWVESAALVDADPIEGDAVVTASLPERDPALVPGVECKVVDAGDGDCRVELRTGDQFTLPKTAVRRRESAISPADVVDCARSFLGTGYEWGGKTADGIDCSGLVWIAYRAAGVRLPRDSDQQQRVGTAVERDELAPGDLLFFPGHVAISLGGPEFVHAYGGDDEVTINSLDPDAEGYLPDLDEGFETARRVVAE